jgi:hypothetical protein
MDENFWGGLKKPFLRGCVHRHPLIFAFFLRGCLCRHFDLFFLGVQILLTSSIGGGVYIKWNGPIKDDVKMACSAHVWICHAILMPFSPRLWRPRPRFKPDLNLSNIGRGVRAILQSCPVFNEIAGMVQPDWYVGRGVLLSPSDAFLYDISPPKIETFSRGCLEPIVLCIWRLDAPQPVWARSNLPDLGGVIQALVGNSFLTKGL